MDNKKEIVNTATGGTGLDCENRHVGYNPCERQSTTLADVLKDVVHPEDFGSKSTEELKQCLLFCMNEGKMLKMRDGLAAFKIVSIYE